MDKKRMAAARLGRVKYKGKACRVCNGNERYVSNGACTSCHARHMKSYKARINEELRLARPEGQEASQ